MKVINEKTENALKKESLTKVFVCSGGREGIPEDFLSDARRVGEVIATSNAAYGNGGENNEKTLMGASYKSYINNAGAAAYFIERTVGAPNLTNEIPYLKGYYMVDDIGELTKEQFINFDIIVILPGGSGTLDELISQPEYGYDYENCKPKKVILYNKQIDGEGFFDGILHQFETCKKVNAITNDFTSKNFTIANNIDELLTLIKESI